MASEADFVEFAAEQMRGAGAITCRKMFGEYGVYCDGLIFALICDNQLYLKPTDAGRAWIGNAAEAPPYPGAKPYFRIDAKLEDADWMAGLVRATVADLLRGTPKAPKRPRAARKGGAR